MIDRVQRLLMRHQISQLKRAGCESFEQLADANIVDKAVKEAVLAQEEGYVNSVIKFEK